MGLSRILRREIDEKMRKIQDNPKYFSQKSALVEDGLRNLADVHSYWLEYPDLRAKLLKETGAKDLRDLQRLAKKGINQVKAGWNYLNSERFKEGKKGMLSYMCREAILNVGKMVEPLRNQGGFRTSFVKLGLRYRPPSPQLVEGLIEELCEDVKNSENHPVEISAEVHLKLAGIQPFNDGNKRTARLFEKRILEGFGYPPAFIAYGERQTYVELLEGALVLGSSSSDSNFKQMFCDYIGGKVNIALDKIVNDLEIP